MISILKSFINIEAEKITFQLLLKKKQKMYFRLNQAMFQQAQKELKVLKNPLAVHIVTKDLQAKVLSRFIKGFT